jgi:hypothetical protein
MKKVAIFAFRGEPGCFAHVLLNAMDMRGKGWDVAVVVEGAATAAAAELAEPGAEFNELYSQVKELGLIDCVCRACAYKQGVLDKLERQGVSWGTELKGHPSMSRYLEEGYEIITL